MWLVKREIFEKNKMIIIIPKGYSKYINTKISSRYAWELQTEVRSRSQAPPLRKDQHHLWKQDS